MLLVVLDFDFTIIEANSDTFVIERLGAKPAFDALSSAGLPWTQLMDRSLGAAAAAGATAADVTAALRSLPLHPSVAAAVRGLAEAGAHVLVVSDANTVYIEEVLQLHGLRGCVAGVHTNPAAYEAGTGALRVQPYHTHSCAAGCPANLCKWEVLRSHLSERAAAGRPAYSAIAYAGDGGGDLCPCLHLLQSQPPAAAEVQVLARAHYQGGQPCRLWAALAAAELAPQARAKVEAWESPAALAELLGGLLRHQVGLSAPAQTSGCPPSFQFGAKGTL